MLCISRIWTILDCHSGYKWQIPIHNNFQPEKCTRPYEVHLRAYIAYTNTMVFDRDSLYISDHLPACAASKGKLRKPSTPYH